MKGLFWASPVFLLSTHHQHFQSRTPSRGNLHSFRDIRGITSQFLIPENSTTPAPRFSIDKGFHSNPGSCHVAIFLAILSLHLMSPTSEGTVSRPAILQISSTSGFPLLPTSGYPPCSPRLHCDFVVSLQNLPSMDSGLKGLSLGTA